MSPEAGKTLQFLSSMPLRELLLETGGQIMACGSLYDIKSKSLGAGVYHVSLRRWGADR